MERWERDRGAPPRADGFAMEVFADEVVPAGRGTVHAVLTVDRSAADDAPGAERPRLRIWTPHIARVRFVRQVLPVARELTDRRRSAGRNASDYPVDGWPSGVRDFHVAVEVPPQPPGAVLLAARAGIVLGAGTAVEELIAVRWAKPHPVDAAVVRWPRPPACPSCAAEVAPREAYCEACGTALAPARRAAG